MICMRFERKQTCYRSFIIVRNVQINEFKGNKMKTVQPKPFFGVKTNAVDAVEVSFLNCSGRI